jgi:hypothetical protein
MEKEYLIEDYVDNWVWKNENIWNGLGHEHIFKSLHKKFSEMIAFTLMSNCEDFLQDFITKGVR